MGTALQNKPQGSLAEQIEATERRLLYRQQMIGIRRRLVSEQIRHRMTSPMALLVAGGIGFIVGDLTRRKNTDAVGSERGPAESPIGDVIDNVVGWIRPIFMAEVGKVMQAFSATASDHLSEQIYRFADKFNSPSDQESA